MKNMIRKVNNIYPAQKRAGGVVHLKFKILSYLFFLLVLPTISCTQRPKIPLTDNLEFALGSKYSDYVKNLNNAYKGNETALKEFFNYTGFYDGSGYDHGWVLIELMRKVGDSKFSIALKEMDKKRLEDLHDYFMAGLDMHSMTISLPHQYPKTFEVLKIIY